MEITRKIVRYYHRRWKYIDSFPGLISVREARYLDEIYEEFDFLMHLRGRLNGLEEGVHSEEEARRLASDVESAFESIKTFEYYCKKSKLDCSTILSLLDDDEA